jgi:hypothetical protein
MKSASAPFAAISVSAIVVSAVSVFSSKFVESANPNVAMNHDGYLIKPQALAPNSAPSSYTTLLDTIITLPQWRALLGLVADIQARCGTAGELPPRSEFFITALAWNCANCSSRK